MSSSVFWVILVLISVIIIFLVRKIFTNKKNHSKEANYLKKDITILNKKNTIGRSLNRNHIADLPIKVEKINIKSKELEKNKKVSLPIITIPIISEVVSGFYPVIRDNDKFKVVFTPEIMEQLKSGTATMMKTKDGSDLRAMAVTADGKKTILEHAKLVREIDPALVLNASFHLASVIVAQQHMQQINQSLKQIKRQLDDIKNFHINNYLFHAKGNIDYFETRIIPHFQATGSTDYIIRNQAEDRFNKTIDILPNILSQLEDLSSKIDNKKSSVLFGKPFGEEKEVTELREILNEYTKIQEIANIYFKWIRGMYIPFLHACGYSDFEILTVENRVKRFEDENENSFNEVHQKITNWTDSFKVKLFRFNKNKYIEKSTTAIKMALPKPSSKVKTEPIIDGINRPLELVIEYVDNEINTYLIENPN